MKGGLSKEKTLPMLKNTSLIILGTIILAFGTSVFQVQFDLVMGGMAGIAIILTKLITGIEFLTVDFYVWTMTIMFFIMGIIFLGKSFTMKTLISTIVYPVSFSLCGMLVSSDAFGSILRIGEGTHTDAALVIASIFGGLLDGVGTAISFLGGGSTGGVDVLAITVEKKTKKITSARVLLIINTVVILLGVFVIGDLVLSLLGVVSAFVSATAIDRMFCGNSKAFTAHIVSDKYEEINRAIIEDFNRTSTFIHCTGGFSGEEKKMLMVAFNMRQYSSLLSTVLRIDKNAFITVHKAHEINGEEWTWGMNERAAREAENALGAASKSDPCEENA